MAYPGNVEALLGNCHFLISVKIATDVHNPANPGLLSRIKAVKACSCQASYAQLLYTCIPVSHLYSSQILDVA